MSLDENANLSEYLQWKNQIIHSQKVLQEISDKNNDVIAKLLSDNKPIKLELGAGKERQLEGWTTIDIGGDCDLILDLRNPLPFPDESVSEIYSSHVLEHFLYPYQMADILNDSCRVLKKGGIFSVCVPNAQIYIEAYLNPEKFDAAIYCQFKPAYHYKSPIDYINYIAYMAGHHYHLFDEDNLVSILSQAGFNNVRLRDFDPNIDIESRKYESIYAIAEKTSIINIDITTHKQKVLNKSCLQITSSKLTEMNIDEDQDNWKLTTPVAFLIFNRPDTTTRVFEVIRNAKPPKLLVVADGARVDQFGEVEKCAATREIINQVDWECEVLTNYSDVNLGCRKRVSSGLDWVFEQVEEAIILEDDCLPHPTFFRYCQELLEKYRDDQRIMMISGDNFQFGRNRTENSYYFSRYGHIWGWASWRRAWTKYDDSMQLWPRLKNQGWLSKVLGNEQAVSYWTQIFQAVYDGFNTWDYIWLFTLWANNGLTILPQVNLVSNIGFGSGTHTTMSNSPLANMSVEAMTFPLKHPLVINRNSEADNFTEQVQFSGSGTISQSSTVESVPKCKVCNSDSHYFANAKILQKYDVNYFQCSNCGFVQTEEPYWLDEAYSEAIATSDVGLVYRNNMMANITGKLLFNYFDHQAKFLDYGGGYGLFVRLMRDQGFDFYWFDKFCQNIFAKGFELQATDKENLEIITAFELFEHLTNPLQELKEIIDLCPNILFSTELLPEDNPTPDKWWYYTPHEGQHISIYTRQSLEILASKHNLKLYTDGKSLHLLTTKENLPENLFESLAKNELQSPNKESLLYRDFNQVVKNILLNNRNSNITETVNISEPKQPIIIIDGVFFQSYQTGIARVWRSLLEQWANTDFANHILVLDRANTAPKINGISYRSISPYNYNNTEADKQMLQEICEQEAAELFISTYYTTPIETPSVFMAYDMIPELLRGNLNEPMWREKHNGIQHALAYISISENTAKDIHKCFPDIPLESITVAHCGVDPLFSPASEDEIKTFKYKYGIHKPYFLLVGTGTGYKNGLLFFQAFSKLASNQGFDIICTGIGGMLAPEFRAYTSGNVVHLLQLSDEELALAYSGAVALVYPSKYEGFGMPVLEAIACGCPVITCPNASIPEVIGEAAIYVNDNDVEGLINALCEVQKPNIRKALITAGLAQAKKFSWTKMAETVSKALIDTTLLSLNLKETNLIIFPDWSQSEDELGLELQQVIQSLANHPKSSNTTLLISISGVDAEEAAMFLSSVTMNLLMEEDLDISEDLELVPVGNLAATQWEALLPRIHARIILSNEDKQAIAAVPGGNIKSYELDTWMNQISSSS